jgi:glucose-6-phosphate isomerase
LVAALGESGVAAHFAAVSSRVDRAVAFGIRAERVFGFEDWVGGRYSLWGPVGLTVAMAIGAAHWEALLCGARAMDLHFRTAPLQENLPVVMALLGWCNVELGGMGSLAFLPYAQDLDRFPAYLQQTDMESNGKSMGRDGHRVGHATGPVVWGESGTNGQHAFYQLLHQGTERIPTEFIAFREPLGSEVGRHDLLLANAIAQAQALMAGQTPSQALQVGLTEGLPPATAAQRAPHRIFEGNRPSGFSLLDRLDPHHLGMLLAAHEHRIFVQGYLWNIHSFDQWGVELGKQLALRILADQKSGAISPDHDGSTAALLRASGLVPD